MSEFCKCIVQHWIPVLILTSSLNQIPYELEILFLLFKFVICICLDHICLCRIMHSFSVPPIIPIVWCVYSNSLDGMMKCLFSSLFHKLLECSLWATHLETYWNNDKHTVYYKELTVPTTWHWSPAVSKIWIMKLLMMFCMLIFNEVCLNAYWTYIQGI